ncbi:hypothetical protein NUW54_g13538 [Trametes sanguinea]|uniref:Uncharacterized protein n=1 Tax=Trametes sanguinea TaxID=158606 RepID=A0ACC1MKI2_9APHY|nr:hypothetical protein NUW54_g13538 [Trametes sanguinea]
MDASPPAQDQANNSDPSPSSGTTTTTTTTVDQSSRPLLMAYYPDWAGDAFPPEKVDFSRFDWIDFAFAVRTLRETSPGTARRTRRTCCSGSSPAQDDVYHPRVGPPAPRNASGLPDLLPATIHRTLRQNPQERANSALSCWVLPRVRVSAKRVWYRSVHLHTPAPQRWRIVAELRRRTEHLCANWVPTPCHRSNGGRAEANTARSSRRPLLLSRSGLTDPSRADLIVPAARALGARSERLLSVDEYPQVCVDKH